MKRIPISATFALIAMTAVFAGTNQNFGNCHDDGSRFSYAPDSLTIDGAWKHMTALTSNDYARCDWWPVYDITPETQSNEYPIATGWTKTAYDNTREEVDWVDSGTTNEQGEVIWDVVTNIVHFSTYSISRNYTIGFHPIPEPTPRKFSKLKIYGAMVELNAWDNVKTWLESKEINGINGWMAFQLAQEISDDHPLFKPLLKEAEDLLGLTDDQMQVILNRCLLEEN